MVDKFEVENEAFTVRRRIRDTLLTIPDRIAGIVSAEPDQRKNYDLLMKEITAALEELSNPPYGNRAA